MLAVSDLFAAKLLVQTGQLPETVVRAQLYSLTQDPHNEQDLLTRLAWQRLLDFEPYKQLRFYVALYEFLRHESFFIRELEERGLAQDEVYDLIAMVEKNAYRRRLGDMMLELGKLSPADAASVGERALEQCRAEDRMLLERYPQEDFSGVANPLIYVERIEVSSFRLSSLFRSDQTVERIDLRLLRADPDEPGLPQPGQPIQRDEQTDDTQVLTRAQLSASRRIRAVIRGLKQIGPYEVVRRLGTGRMGIVYLARSPLGELAAIKVNNPATSRRDERARFEREGKILGQIQHPCVVGLIERGQTDDGFDWIAIEAVEGDSLRELYEARSEPLEPERAFDILAQLLRALTAVHDAGFVHRDLKPENVLLAEGGQVKLVDFGIARATSADSRDWFRSAQGAVSGSPAYIAPETILCDAIDGRTDLYSLGVMLFELFSGRLPLSAESRPDFLKEHLVAIPPTLQSARPELYWAPELEQLIASLLAKDLADRPASAAEILERLPEIREKTLSQLHAPPPLPRKSGILNRFFKKLSGE